jgi:hypothetical protein
MNREDIAKTFHDLLEGNSPNGIQPEQCGEWAKEYEALVEAYKKNGPDGVRKAWISIVKLRPALDKLISEWTDDDSNGNGKSPHGSLTFDELLNTEFSPIQWAIPNILPEGLSILAGRPKVGKSWLGLQITQAVAIGGKVFGSDVERGNVLYIPLEDSPRRIKARMVKQGWPKGSTGKIFTGPIDLSNDLTGFLNNLQQNDYRLVVIDTLSRALAGSINQNKEELMTPILSKLQRSAHDTKTTLLVIDHHKKGGIDDPIDDIMGSTGKAAVADGVIGLYRNRGEKTATLKLIGRDIDEQEMFLQFDQVTCCWQPVVDQRGVKPNTIQGKIVKAIKDMGGKATLTAIANYLKKDKGNVSKELTELVSKGALVRCEGKEKEKPYKLP